jgi:phosphoribosylamine--glycine ligase
MKILVLGSGGREHAIVWKFRKSGHNVWCAPGNAGICRMATGIDLNPENVTAVADYAEKEGFDLTVVGPEGPLVAGLVDGFLRRRLPIFGPSRAAAQLEGSKAFAKALMRDCGIPTARFETFSDAARAKTFVAGHQYPLVIKASGLALGKGAVIVRSREEADQVIDQMLVQKTLGGAGDNIVIEDFLSGEEASIIGITDGEQVVYLAPSQDHKALLDGDLGPNTGGMGAYAPAPLVTRNIMQAVEQKVFTPLLQGLRRQGIEYRGVIYAGIMITEKGPYVLEFNCRFGDPETQVILPLLQDDLAELLLDAASGKLAGRHPPTTATEHFGLCVVAASAGYPGAYRKGIPVQGELGLTDEVMVFHAGTRQVGSHVVTSGGRVLGVTALGASLSEAKRASYAALSRISFEGMQFRHDIGDKGILRLEGNPGGSSA